MIDGHIVADFCRFADHYTHAVVDKKTPPDSRTGVDFDAGQPACDMRQETRQPFQVGTPQPIRQAVRDTRVQARVTGQHFKGAARRRIAVEYAGDIFFNVAKHPDSLVDNAI